MENKEYSSSDTSGQSLGRTMREASDQAPSYRDIKPTVPDVQQIQQQQKLAAEGFPCPHCGTINEPEAMYCASCGQPIDKVPCPNCGEMLDPDADYCEKCHTYIKKDICSFCGEHLSESDTYCPSCGSPRGSVICPVCHTENQFSFCRKCGTPLTDKGRELVKQMQKDPEYKRLMATANELARLDNCLPFSSEREIQRTKLNEKLRDRVLMLLAKDSGVDQPVIKEQPTKRMSREDLNERKTTEMNTLTAILEKLAVQPSKSPVQARNYAMACKPQGVRLAWVCNYKHAMHSSPCGCAKPHLGGKWVILGRNSQVEIKDDKK